MTIARLRAGLVAAALTAPGCGTTDPSPLTNLDGTWSLGYSARAGTSCPAPAPPDLVPGCGGGARVEFQARGDVLVVTSDGRGGCQSCSGAVDYLVRDVTATVEGNQLTMQVTQCRLTGPLPAATDDTAQGETVCGVGNELRGTWRMVRASQ